MASRHNTQELVKDLELSGLTHKAYCKQENIPASTLAYHLRKHRNRQEKRKTKQKKASFFPVDLKVSRSSRSRTLIVLKGDFSCNDLIKIVSANL